MTSVLYRLNDGEVLAISLSDTPFLGVDGNYYGVLIDPPFLNGTDIREDLGDEQVGPLRQLGYCKKWDGVNVRNATQTEINGMPANADDVEANQDVNAVYNDFNTHPRHRRAIAALIKRVLAEDERLRFQWEQFKSDVVSANSFTDLQLLISNYSVLTPRTFSQAKTALLNDISKDD